LSPDAGRLWTEVGTAGPTAIVVGEERKGLTKGIMDVCDERVRLPMAGRADSLNVAVAAGVMVYEMVRRRGLAGCGRGGCASGAGA
jgi:tRNA G18 (ribose-2'-O)-methylase SpoU